MLQQLFSDSLFDELILPMSPQRLASIDAPPARFGTVLPDILREMPEELILSESFNSSDFLAAVPIVLTPSPAAIGWNSTDVHFFPDEAADASSIPARVPRCAKRAATQLALDGDEEEEEELLAPQEEDEDEDLAELGCPAANTDTWAMTRHVVALPSGGKMEVTEAAVLVDLQAFRAILKRVRPEDRATLKALRRRLQNRDASRKGRKKQKAAVAAARRGSDNVIETTRTRLEVVGEHLAQCTRKHFGMLPGGEDAIAAFMVQVMVSLQASQ